MQRSLIPALIPILIAGCAHQPPEPPPAARVADTYVVLMENTDGTTGKIIVRDQSGQATTVDQAGYGVQLAQPEKGVQQIDADKLHRDFDNTIAARPVLPVTFTLHFKTGGTELTAESRAMIPEVLREVEHRTAPDISIIGHTDTVGKADANEALALERAKAMEKVIRQAGLSIKEITVASHGERNLLVPTPDNTPEEKNRRIEITIR